MKILLVALTKEFLRAEKPNSPKGTIFLRFPSLALANIAALTPEEDEIIVVDEQISPVDYSVPIDLVAISVNTSVAPRAYEIADRFRKKGVTVVLGGLHPDLFPQEARQHADALMLGDADGIWERLITDFKRGKIKKKYVNTQKNSLADLPVPRWDIFKGMGYVNTNFVETSRGCIYKCSFCSTAPFYKHTHRTRPIKDVIRDIKNVKSFPKKFIFFVDDNIIGDRAYAKRLFKALIPLNICWIGQATVSIGEDEELVRLAAESGCFGLFLGFESVSKSNLVIMKKIQNHFDRYEGSIKTLHKHGIAIEGGFIFGMDNDDPAIFQHTLDFLIKTEMDGFLAIYLTPIPGTPLHTQFKKEGRLTSDDYSQYDFRHLVFKPKSMTSKELRTGVSWIAREFHARRRIAGRVFRKLGQLLLHPSKRRLFGMVGVLAIGLGFRKRIKDLSVDGTF